MSLYMETTSIQAEETVLQIQRILGRYGASAIMMEYEGGEIKALSFRVKHNNVEIPFRLPCRTEPIFIMLIAKKKRVNKEVEKVVRDQSKNVGWRQIFQWVQAQMALIETKMVTMPEVFMPYIQIDLKGRTLYEEMDSKGFKMLPNHTKEG